MKRRTKAWAVLTSVALAGAITAPSTITFAKGASYNTNPSVQEVGDKFRSETLQEAMQAGKIDLSGAESAGGEASGTTQGVTSVTQDDVGVVKKWLTNNDVTGGYALTDFTLRAVGKYGEVWVANNLNYPDGDPRQALAQITDEQVEYLLDQFDNNMYEKEISFFGKPAERTGANGYNGWYNDESGRVVILVDNIKDSSFYNPNYPSYIAGYFSSTISDFSDRNVMTIDCYDWIDRMGPNVARPYMYEGTFAHEFQHLLHRDTDSAEENFINEGLSDFAQYMVGYGHSTSHVSFFEQNPKNSLTMWGDQSDLQILGDYGTAYLFELYMYERFGQEFIQALFKNQKQGIAGVNDTLQQMGYDLDFTELYNDFSLATLIDGKYQGSDKYRFDNIDLNVNTEAASQLASDVPAWGTDYKVITPSKKIDHLYFKGIDFLGTNWTAAEDPERGNVLWANEGDLADNHLIKELDLTGLTDATLTFDTKYDIEEQWDFGAVQVSTDGGKSWTSLANGDTRSDLVDDGHPTIAANLPGFTGSSNGWTTESFDLSQYAGQNVLLSFRYMTDWGYNEAGWYISNVRLNGNVVDAATSTDGFLSLAQATQDHVDYQVSFVGYKKGNATGQEAHVKVLRFDDPLNFDADQATDLRNMLHSNEFSKVVMLTTYAAPQGTNGTVDYDYEVLNKSNKKK
ncbi:MAG TPA: choice-of-anchor J domain-containing protein [Bacilli bacterium]|nr:choice-of-anchor J domain-containing protein [Bacilli bacterium]